MFWEPSGNSYVQYGHEHRHTYRANPCRRLLDQAGAVWVSSTDTEGVEFNQPGTPSYGVGFERGGPPAAAESVFILDPSKTAWTLSAASSLGGEWDIDFQVSASTAAATASSTPPSTTTPAAAAAFRRYEPARPVEVRIDDVPALKIASKPGKSQRPMPVGAISDDKQLQDNFI